MLIRFIGWVADRHRAMEVRRRIAAMHRSLDMAELWIAELRRQRR